ncbi:hypothetical protein BDK51DRAFT_50418, partial [Blyttiomyces helicus]
MADQPPTPQRVLRSRAEVPNYAPSSSRSRSTAASRTQPKTKDLVDPDSPSKTRSGRPRYSQEALELNAAARASSSPRKRRRPPASREPSAEPSDDGAVSSTSLRTYSTTSSKGPHDDEEESEELEKLEVLKPPGSPLGALFGWPTGRGSSPRVESAKTAGGPSNFKGRVLFRADDVEEEKDEDEERDEEPDAATPRASLAGIFGFFNWQRKVVEREGDDPEVEVMDEEKEDEDSLEDNDGSEETQVEAELEEITGWFLTFVSISDLSKRSYIFPFLIYFPIAEQSFWQNTAEYCTDFRLARLFEPIVSVLVTPIYWIFSTLASVLAFIGYHGFLTLPRAIISVPSWILRHALKFFSRRVVTIAFLLLLAFMALTFKPQGSGTGDAGIGVGKWFAAQWAAISFDLPILPGPRGPSSHGSHPASPRPEAPAPAVHESVPAPIARPDTAMQKRLALFESNLKALSDSQADLGAKQLGFAKHLAELDAFAKTNKNTKHHIDVLLEGHEKFSRLVETLARTNKANTKKFTASSTAADARLLAAEKKIDEYREALLDLDKDIKALQANDTEDDQQVALLGSKIDATIAKAALLADRLAIVEEHTLPKHLTDRVIELIREHVPPLLVAKIDDGRISMLPDFWAHLESKLASKKELDATMARLTSIEAAVASSMADVSAVDAVKKELVGVIARLKVVEDASAHDAVKKELAGAIARLTTVEAAVRSSSADASAVDAVKKEVVGVIARLEAVEAVSISASASAEASAVAAVKKELDAVKVRLTSIEAVAKSALTAASAAEESRKELSKEVAKLSSPAFLGANEARLKNLIAEDRATGVEKAGVIVTKSEVLAFVEQYLQKLDPSIRAAAVAQAMDSIPTSANDSHIESLVTALVRTHLERFAADILATPDFALESGGGRIDMELTSPSATLARSDGWGTVLGYKKIKGPPVNAIKPEVLPGNCWAMEGSNGTLGVVLASPIYPTAVTVQHVPPSLLPVEQLSSAPKRLEFWGVADTDRFHDLDLESPDVRAHTSLGSRPAWLLAALTFDPAERHIVTVPVRGADVARERTEAEK